MDFSHFLAEWTAYIIMPIIILGNNIRVDVIGVNRAHTAQQIDEKSAKNGAKTPWKWRDWDSVLNDISSVIDWLISSKLRLMNFLIWLGTEFE